MLLYTCTSTFLLNGVHPDAKVVKGGEPDELDETVEVFQLVLNGSTGHCPAMVCVGEVGGKCVCVCEEEVEMCVYG